MVQVISKPGKRVKFTWAKGVRNRTEVTGGEILADRPGESLRFQDMRRLNLPSADLHALDLEGTDFSQSRMENSSFRSARLVHTRLNGTMLTYADFSGATLDGADFTGAFLMWADFSDCDMSNACFENARVKFVYYNHNTIWPEGLSPEGIDARRVG
jgi:uncharacterized protein YjbI with pentapeptide repeats